MPEGRGWTESGRSALAGQPAPLLPPLPQQYPHLSDNDPHLCRYWIGLLLCRAVENRVSYTFPLAYRKSKSDAELSRRFFVIVFVIVIAFLQRDSHIFNH